LANFFRGKFAARWKIFGEKNLRREENAAHSSFLRGKLQLI
jgi:hypothetical protein